MEIIYCHKCGIRVDPSDIERRKAITHGSGATYCPDCARIVVADVATGQRKSSHALLPVAQPKRGKSSKTLIPAVRSNKTNVVNESAATPRRPSARQHASG